MCSINIKFYHLLFFSVECCRVDLHLAVQRAGAGAAGVVAAVVHGAPNGLAIVLEGQHQKESLAAMISQRT